MPRSDRAFRALSRAQPDVVAELLRVLAPDLVPRGVALLPDDVAPTQVDGLPPEMDADWADAGEWSADELCARVARALKERGASWAERHMAVVAAAMRQRYEAMVSAMEQANLEPVVIEDLVKFGEDRGYERGHKEGQFETWTRLFVRRLGRPLTEEERATLARRLSVLGEERLDGVMLSFGPAALAVWLADPAAR